MMHTYSLFVHRQYVFEYIFLCIRRNMETNASVENQKGYLEDAESEGNKTRDKKKTKLSALKTYMSRRFNSSTTRKANTKDKNCARGDLYAEASSTTSFSSLLQSPQLIESELSEISSRYNIGGCTRSSQKIIELEASMPDDAASEALSSIQVKSFSFLESLPIDLYMHILRLLGDYSTGFDCLKQSSEK